ncbi:MAG: efflux RND transporter periplasmic adaptor subunit [Pseudomonadota bacterium]
MFELLFPRSFPRQSGKVLTALTFGLLLGACSGEEQAAANRGAAAPVLVETTVASIESMDRRAEAVGTLIGSESVVITAKVTEQVSAVFFEGGEFVKSGQVLVELIDEEQLALLKESEAKLEETRLQLKRLASLGAEIATAAEIDVARTRVAAAEAVLQALRSRIADRVIKAPFDGVIGFRQISVGALLTPGTVIAQLDAIDPLKLDFTLPEHFFSQVAIGDSIWARSTAWPAEIFEGGATLIGTRIDPVTRAFPVRGLLDNPDGRLRPGMLMAVEVSLGRSDGIVVPESALLQTGAQSSVYLVDESNTARRVSVTIGRRAPGTIEILSGVQEGDRVVTSGQLTLRPGVAVRQAEEPPSAVVSS